MKKMLIAAALLLTGCAAGTQNAELPAVLFYEETQFPKSEDESAPHTTVVFLTKDGTFYSGAGGFTVDEIAAQYDAGTLGEHFSALKCGTDAETAAQQYQKLCKAAKEPPQIIYPDAVPAVEAPQPFWYTWMPDDGGTQIHISMGEEFCGTFCETDNETVNEICAWFENTRKG